MLSKLIEERQKEFKKSAVDMKNVGFEFYGYGEATLNTLITDSMKLAYEAGKQAERLRISNTWYKAFTDLEMRYGLIRVAEFRIKTEATTPPQPNHSEDLAV